MNQVLFPPPQYRRQISCPPDNIANDFWVERLPVSLNQRPGVSPKLDLTLLLSTEWLFHFYTSLGCLKVPPDFRWCFKSVIFVIWGGEGSEGESKVPLLL